MLLKPLLQGDGREWVGIGRKNTFNPLRRGRKGLFSAIGWAGILHGILLLILIFSWQHSVEKTKALQLRGLENAASLKANSNSNSNSKPEPMAKLNAYLLITPSLSPSTEKKNSAPSKQLESISEIVQSIELTVTEEPIRPRLEYNTLKPVLKLSAAEMNMGHKSIAKEASDPEGGSNKDVSAVIGTPSKDKVKAKGTGNKLKQFSQQYLERAQYRAIERLTAGEADNYTQKRSMSKLDGDMEPLWVSESKPTVEERIQSIKNLDLGLDPNRRVRVGDTCYQVVKVGTQVNPYAENLGYAFNCGGDKVQLQLDKLIAERLNKVR